MVLVREWTYKRAGHSLRRRLEVEREDLAGQKLYVNVVEGLTVSVPGLSIERFGQADRFRQRSPELCEVEGAMWRLSAKSFQDGVELELDVQNRTTTPWPDPFALETTVSVRAPQNPNQVTAPLLADPDRQGRTLMHSGTDFHRIADQRRHFWHQQQIEEIAALPEMPEILQNPDRRPAVPYLGVGAIFRVTADGKWVLAYGWERTACVSCYDDNDALVVSVQLGPLKVGEHRRIRGLLLLTRSSRDDALARFRRHVGGKTGYEVRARRRAVLEAVLARRPRPT